MAGIEPLEGGYRRFRVAPLPGGGLHWAERSVRTPYGEIRSRWEFTNRQFRLTVTVPPCTECEITLPGGTARSAGSGTWTYEEDLQ